MLTTRPVKIFVFACLAISIMAVGNNICYGDPILVDPPVATKLININDHLYFITPNNVVKKYLKDDLIEIGERFIPGCYNLCYSDYIDEILIVSGNNPCTLQFLNYADMVLTGQYVFNGKHISDLVSVGDRLYVAWDNSNIMDAEVYDPYHTPPNTGALTEITMQPGHNFIENWTIAIASIPYFIEDAGDYVVVSSEEFRRGSCGDDKIAGSTINVVEKSSQNLDQFIVSMESGNYIEYDGVDKVYISNPSGLYLDISGPSMKKGLSVLDLGTMSIEHIALEGLIGEDWLWGADGTCYVDPYLYIAYCNTEFEGTLYYGKYDTNLGILENIPLPFTDKRTAYVQEFGTDLYFVTYDGWLIKFEGEDLEDPICILELPEPGTETNQIQILCRESSTDTQSLNLHCSWDMGTTEVYDYDRLTDDIPWDFMYEFPYVDGTYYITMTVYDDSGNYCVDNTDITIDTTSPYCVIASPAEPLVYQVEQEIVFGENSYDASSELLILWDFGDLQQEEYMKYPPYSGTFTTHAYSLPGTYIVTLYVTDKAGNICDDDVIVTVVE